MGLSEASTVVLPIDDESIGCEARTDWHADGWLERTDARSVAQCLVTLRPWAEGSSSTTTIQRIANQIFSMPANAHQDSNQRYIEMEYEYWNARYICCLSIQVLECLRACPHYPPMYSATRTRSKLRKANATMIVKTRWRSVSRSGARRRGPPRRISRT